MKKEIQGYWDFFEFTFKVGDTFKHTLKSVEKL